MICKLVLPLILPSLEIIVQFNVTALNILNLKIVHIAAKAKYFAVVTGKILLISIWSWGWDEHGSLICDQTNLHFAAFNLHGQRSYHIQSLL